MAKSIGYKVIYRRVATKSELQYYLKRFGTSEYNNYSVFYLSFHGYTQRICLEGEKKDECVVSLEELSEMANGAFENKFVHFSSCRTMLGSENSLEQFKINTGAAYISGYTTSVNGVLSAINERM